jgi:hypothetical protein
MAIPSHAAARYAPTAPELWPIKLMGSPRSAVALTARRKRIDRPSGLDGVALGEPADQAEAQPLHTISATADEV